MAAFATPPTDVKVNTYVSLDDANAILANRLYTDAWNNASQSPGARNYVVDDPGATLGIGSTSIPIKDGLGDWTNGTQFSFGDPGSPVYTVVGDFAEGVSPITIEAPGIIAPVPLDGAPLYRWTPNEKESALIWAACVLDGNWDWYGFPRYAIRGTTAITQPQQNLRWPRAGVYTLDGYPYQSEVYPDSLLHLTAEQALYLLQNDYASTPAVMGLGFKKAEIPGPLKVEVDTSQVVGLAPTYLWTKYRNLGEPAPGANPGSMQFYKMVRT